MYIRRKVFSLLQDENGEERYFSTTDILMEDEEERLFSILSYEELEQKEFARKDYEGLTEAQQKDLKMRRDELAKEFNRRRHIYNDEDFLEELDYRKNKYLKNKKLGKSSKFGSVEDVVKAAERNERETLIQRLKGKKQLAHDTIKDNYSFGEYGPTGSSKKSIKNVPVVLGKNSDKIIEGNSEVAKEAAEKVAKTAKTAPSRVAEEAAEKVTKRSLKLGKGGKIALGTAAGLGALYGAKKLYDKNKKDKK